MIRTQQIFGCDPTANIVHHAPSMKTTCMFAHRVELLRETTCK